MLLGVPVNVTLLLLTGLASGWTVRSLLLRGFLLRRTPADMYIAGFILWASLGALLNPHALQNLLGVLYLCSGGFVLFFLASQTTERNLGRIRGYMRGLGWITIAVSLWGVVEYAVGSGLNDGGTRAVSSLGDPNVLALYLTMTLPLLLYLRLSDGKRHARQIWTSGVLLTVACLMLTFSRSGYIAFFISTLAFLSRWRRGLFLGALVGGVLLIGVVQFSGIERLNIRSALTSVQARRMIQLYVSVLDGAKNNLLLGVGWRNWKVALDQEESEDSAISLGPLSLPRTLQNMYLTLLVEQGLVGLFFMLLIFMATLRGFYHASYQVQDQSVQMLLWAIFSSTLGFMTHMLFFDSFYFVAVQATFWFLLGLGNGLASEFGTTSQRWYRVSAFQH